MSAGGVDAPRAQAGPHPQHLLSTVLGEYLDSADADLPSAAVVAVLAEFGISEASARAALSRVVKRGVLAVRGGTRPPVYHLTERALARHHGRMHQFLRFGATAPAWDGWWVTVSFSLPQPHQSQRHALRRRLVGLGFARLYDNVWIRPGESADDVGAPLADLLDDVPGARWSLSRARFEDEAGPHGPASAYDLDGLAVGYQEFLDRYAGLGGAAARGEVAGPEALVARTSVMDSWRRFADQDPDLPAHLLPAGWPRARARELFLSVHSALGPLAQARLIEVTAPHWPDGARWITHYRSADDASRAPVRAQG